MKLEPSAAAYVRVSTAEQNHALQRHAIEQAAGPRGDAELRWFSETRSGGGWERPELEKLRQLVFSGAVRRVYVWKLDRFSRRGIADTVELVQGFRRAGCELISITEGWDFAGIAGDSLLSALAWSAQMELSKHHERLRGARARMAGGAATRRSRERGPCGKHTRPELRWRAVEPRFETGMRVADASRA